MTTDQGTYTLLVVLEESASIRFGAAGERHLQPGGYAYTGSAFGPGGFARLERHRELATGERDMRHWHIDYLLGHPASRIAAVVKTAGMDCECSVASRLDAEPVPGIGASDCDCETHLAYASDVDALRHAVQRAHDRATDQR